MGTKAKLALYLQRSQGGQSGAKTMVNGADVGGRQRVHRKKECPEGAGTLVSRERSTG